MPAQAIAHVIDAETVHNWRQRYEDLPHYADLSESCKWAIRGAWDAHHRNGADARQEAERLAAQFPEELTLTAVG